jgi:hypothetical protein
MMASCPSCRFFSKQVESWELLQYWWYECAMHGHYANLRSFPFKNGCKSFEKRKDAQERGG